VFRDDYVMRQIQQAMEAVARAFGALAGARREEAFEELDQAYDALLEHNRGMMDVVDTATLARLVGSPERVRALAKVSKADGDLRAELGDEVAAARAQARALALLRIAHAEDPDDEDADLLAELERATGEPGGR